MDIKIKKDGSLRAAYGWFAVIFLVVAVIGRPLGFDEAPNFLFGAGLLVLMSIYQIFTQHVLTIDDTGITPRWKKTIPWSDIRKLKFEKKSFSNKHWIAFEISAEGKIAPYVFDVKRTDARPSYVLDTVMEYAIEHGYDIVLEGLDTK